MRIATPAFFWDPFAWKMVFHPLTFSLNVSLGSKWISCRQQMDGSFLFIQSATLWRFMEEFKPWTLRVHTERYDFNDDMFSGKALYRLWLSALYHSWGLFTFIEPPLISPVGLVSWLRNWSMSGDSGSSLFLHQSWITALLDKGSLAACFSLREL